MGAVQWEACLIARSQDMTLPHSHAQVTTTAAYTGAVQAGTLQAAWTACGVLLGVAQTSFDLQLPAPVSITAFIASAATITRHELCLCIAS